MYPPLRRVTTSIRGLSMSYPTTASLLHAWRKSSPANANHTDNEPIHILGIGNIGKLVAHSLAKSTRAPPVTILFHRSGLASDWHEAGQCIDVVTNGSSDKQHGFTIECDVDSDSIIKNLVVATKTHATTAAMQPFKHRLTNESTILFLQNGMGTIEEVTASIFPIPSKRPYYLAGITSHGVYATGPFSVVHAGFGTTTVGAVLPPDCERVTPDSVARIPHSSQYLLEQILHAPVLCATAVTPFDLFQAQLEKLIVNAMINPLTVIFDCHNGQLFCRRPILALMRQLLTEASAVVRVLICSSDNAVERRFSQPVLEEVVRDVAVKTGANISSMLQDVRAGRKTEIDYINGYIVARGADLGIDCIHNRMLMRMAKDRNVISESQIPAFFLKATTKPVDFIKTSA